MSSTEEPAGEPSRRLEGRVTRRVYLVTIGGGLLGLERVIGLFRRRRIVVAWFSVQAAEKADRFRVMLTLESPDHEQVRRQLARLVEVLAQTDIEEGSRDEAA